jgi:hypothetical protein
MHNIILLLVESPCEPFRCIINLHCQQLLLLLLLLLAAATAATAAAPAPLRGWGPPLGQAPAVASRGF